MRFVDVPTGSPATRSCHSPAAFHRAVPDTVADRLLGEVLAEAPTDRPAPTRSPMATAAPPASTAATPSSSSTAAPAPAEATSAPRRRVPLAPTRRPNPVLRSIRRAWSDLRWSLSTLLHSRRRSALLARAAARTAPDASTTAEPVYVVFGAPA